MSRASGGPAGGAALLPPVGVERHSRLAGEHEASSPVNWHDLRHTFRSLLVACSVDLVSIKDAMGHFQADREPDQARAHPPGPVRQAAPSTGIPRPRPLEIPARQCSISEPRAATRLLGLSHPG